MASTTARHSLSPLTIGAHRVIHLERWSFEIIGEALLRHATRVSDVERNLPIDHATLVEAELMELRHTSDSPAAPKFVLTTGVATSRTPTPSAERFPAW